MTANQFSSRVTPLQDDELEEGLDRWTSEHDQDAVWAKRFLAEYLASQFLDGRPLELAIRSTHRPTELQDFLFRLYARHFVIENGAGILEFARVYRGAQLIAVHVSCRPRLHLALASVESFSNLRDPVQHLTVIGQESAHDMNYSFDPDARTLTVPAPDNYEGLAQKMAKLYRFLGFCGTEACVMKLDDDIHCDPNNFSSQAITDMVLKHNYVGRVNWPQIHGIHRWWHLGKCEDGRLNSAPYSLIADCSYANGPAYFLSPAAINILAKASIYLCRAYEIEGPYEDVAVGKILNSFCLEPHYYDALDEGSLISTDTN